MAREDDLKGPRGASIALVGVLFSASFLLFVDPASLASCGSMLNIVRAGSFSSSGGSSAFATPNNHLEKFRRGLLPVLGTDSAATTPLRFTLLAGSGDFGGTHSDISGGRPFVAAAVDVLSSHRCVGAPPEGGSCHFRNLYYTSSVVGLPDPFAAVRNSGTWTYAVAVPAAEVESGAWGENALRKLVADIEAELQCGGLTLSSRRPAGPSNFWGIGIAVLSAAPLQGPLIKAARTRAGAPQPILAPVGGEGGAVVCTTGASSMVSPCLPPGVITEVQQSFFLLHRTNCGNIGHSLWDDAIPFFAAMKDLGLTPRLREFALLHTESSGPWPRTWGNRGAHHAVREMFSLIVPRSAELVELDRALISQVALVREIAGGLTGMSPHNMRRDMRAYGSERRVVWHLRNTILRAGGFNNDVEGAANGTGISAIGPVDVRVKPLKLLFVRSKRPLWNERELLANIAEAFPELDVEAIAWEDLGGGAEGFRSEIKRLAQTHVLLSGDGTVAVTVPFLPRGAVHIQLGVPRPWGVQVQCDFLYASLDHVRVLYYNGPLEPSEHGATPFEGFAVPFTKLEPLLHEAVALLRDGFTVPVPEGLNTPPSALLLQHLQRKHEDFAEFMSKGEKINWEE